MQFQRFMKGATDSTENATKDDCLKANEGLIADENEASIGYNKAILVIQGSKLKNREEILRIYREINEDEYVKHLDLLRKAKALIEEGE